MWTFDRALALVALRLTLLATFAWLSASLTRLVGSLPPAAPPSPSDPARRMREHARKGLPFRIGEPILVRVAGLFSTPALHSLRARLSRQLRVAGHPLGLTPDELLALSLVSLVSVALLARWCVVALGLHWALALYLVAFAPVLPVLRVRGQAAQRAKQLDRSLPAAMDLCALCVGAGSDFPGALRLVCSDLGPAHRTCRDELERVLSDLELGATRAAALEALARRTTSAGVHEFVAAVCLAEAKGTPLVETLAIQAASLRRRRSVRAEELAAQAGVKMMLPMLLLVASLMLVIFGPFVVRGAGL